MAFTGATFYNALDVGTDEAQIGPFDECFGHPGPVEGDYHYHPPAFPYFDQGDPENHSPQIGYALDGFGIYIERDSEGEMLSTADLDVCHGRTSTVEWDGEQVEIYHYVATLDFPYLVACYQGTAITEAEGLALGAPSGGGAPSEGGGPPEKGTPSDGAAPPE